VLATATFVGTTVFYDAAQFEHNDIVLSPGPFFSIQDADDVLQRGQDGFQASDFLAGLGYGFDFGIGFDVGVNVHFGIGSEAGGSVGAGISIGAGVGIPFIQEKLPAGLIGPGPALMAGDQQSALGEAFASALAQGSQGVSSVVAGEAIPGAGLDGELFYQIEAANGSVDEYRFFHAIVDPDPGDVFTESEVNDTLEDSIPDNDITDFVGKLVVGAFGSGGPTKDVDVFTFTAAAADIGKQFVVIIDTDPNSVLDDPDADNDDLAARPELQVGFREFDFVEPRRLGSTTTFSDGTALGPFEITREGQFIIHLEDKSLVDVGVDIDYRFVVVEADTERPQGEIERFVFSGPGRQPGAG
jgi:hypothetical protein